jgi:hypothetical protein
MILLPLGLGSSVDDVAIRPQLPPVDWLVECRLSVSSRLSARSTTLLRKARVAPPSAATSRSDSVDLWTQLRLVGHYAEC